LTQQIARPCDQSCALQYSVCPEITFEKYAQHGRSIANVTKDGKHYLLLNQGSFSLWRFSGPQAEFHSEGRVEKSDAPWAKLEHIQLLDFVVSDLPKNWGFEHFESHGGIHHRFVSWRCFVPVLCPSCLTHSLPES